MMTRIRIDDAGQMEIVDPGFEQLELLGAIDPEFQIRTCSLPGFTSPSFLKIRDIGCGIEQDKLAEMSDGELWRVHNTPSGQPAVCPGQLKLCPDNS